MSESYNPFSNPDTWEQPRNPKNVQPTVKTNVIDDYQPFNNEPAILPTEQSQVPKPKVTVEDLEKMQRELEDRSQRLAQEEERFNQSEHAVSKNNFPPFPRCCPMKPCFYQEIDVEIPEQYRMIVKLGFILWIFYSVTLFINIFGALSYMISVQVKSDSGPFFGVSILYFFLFVPLSYVFWFRSLYKAFKNNSSFNFFLFFLIFGCQIIVLIIQVLGINVLGSCGWIISSTSGANINVKVFMLIIALAFTLILAASFYIIIRVNLYFRVSGGSLQKAKEEFNKDALSNQTVRSAAADMLRAK